MNADERLLRLIKKSNGKPNKAAYLMAVEEATQAERDMANWNALDAACAEARLVLRRRSDYSLSKRLELARGIVTAALEPPKGEGT